MEHGDGCRVHTGTDCGQYGDIYRFHTGRRPGVFFATLGVVLPSFFIILIIASILNNLMKYAGVNAFLSGIRPCVVAMILATALSMALSTLLGFSDIKTAIAPDLRAIAVFAILWAVHFAYKKLKNTVPSPILMIVFSAVPGILFWKQ